MNSPQKKNDDLHMVALSILAAVVGILAIVVILCRREVFAMKRAQAELVAFSQDMHINYRCGKEANWKPTVSCNNDEIFLRLERGSSK